ncbi:PTS galactitol transporter subunit IIB, partial [Priestia megaterium]
GIGMEALDQKIIDALNKTFVN